MTVCSHYEEVDALVRNPVEQLRGNRDRLRIASLHFDLHAMPGKMPGQVGSWNLAVLTEFSARVRVDREHYDASSPLQNGQGVCHRARRFPAGVPGNEHTLANLPGHSDVGDDEDGTPAYRVLFGVSGEAERFS